MRARQIGCARSGVWTPAFTGQQVGRFDIQTTYDQHLLAKRCKRLKRRRDFETAALNLGRPVIHDPANRQVDEAHLERRIRGSCRRGEGRNHGIQKRQGQGCAGTTQERAARHEFLSDDHCW